MSSTITVSGAGPAGLTAAITVAAHSGHPVVYDRAPNVGTRFHGDFQGLENWTTAGDVLEELRSIGLDLDCELTPFRELTVFDPDGRAYRYGGSRPLFYLVRRGAGERSLDTALKDQALRLGVDLRFNELRRHLPEGGIVAEGPRGADAIAVGYLFETDAADGAFAAASDRLAPKGYSYLLVHGGRGTVASCLFKDFHRERLYRDRTIEFFTRHAGLIMRNPRRFGGTGNLVAPPSARRGGLLFAGEAAGFQDALWGFGLRYAMLSGHLAALALLEEQPESYDARWQARFGALLRTGIVNRYSYERLRDKGYAALLGRIQGTDVREWLRRQYNSSLLKRVLYPLASRRVRSRRIEAACPVPGCDCTWCRCQHTATEPAQMQVA